MSEPEFFPRAVTPTLADICSWTSAQAAADAPLSAPVTGIAPLESGAAGDLVFFDNPRYVNHLAATAATACLLRAPFADRLRPGTVALISPDPYRAFAIVLSRLFPTALRPGTVFGMAGVAPGASVHPEARLEHGVSIDPGAVVGPRAVIGTGTVVAANAVIGPDVRIGRDCAVGPNASVLNALVGDRVIIHAGARIGQDGFGFVLGARGHQKVPQIGRVIVQDDVEIGANTTIDRGANRDTIVGEGTKIDNLVQIAHNVTLGRHCIIISQVGISGSTTVGDFAMMGGQAGVTGHLVVGTGARLGAQSGLTRDIPAGESWAGSPASRLRDHHRDLVTVRRLSKRRSSDTVAS